MTSYLCSLAACWRRAVGINSAICIAVFLSNACDVSTLCRAAGPPVKIETVPVQSTSYEVFRQQSVLFRASDDITSIAIADPTVCSVTQDSNDPRHAMLIGGKHGDTHVTLWFSRPDQEPMTFLVRVRLSTVQLAALETFLNGEYPGSAIHLNTVPLTGRIQLNGSVHTKRVAKAIENSVVGGGVSEQGLVNRLANDPDLLAMQNYLNGKFPKAKITLTFVPVSGKVLLEGQVPSQHDVDQILKLIVGDEIERERIVNSLKVFCPCSACCGRHRRH